jgi:uncharacterized membrane protein
MPALHSTRVQNKPAAAGVASPVSIVAVWVAGQFGLDMPPEVAAAIATLLVTLAYVLTPAKET